MLNKVQIIGNLGKDPEVRHTASGKAVASFSVAVTSKFADKEETTWFNIIVWEKLADICGNYLTKGSKVYLEGRLQNRTYDKSDGTKGYSTEIVCHQMQMLSPKSEGAGEERQNPHHGSAPARQPAPATRNTATVDEPPFNPDEDIPF